jgi:hypothetical protein
MKITRNFIASVVLLLAVAVMSPKSVQATSGCTYAAIHCQGLGAPYVVETDPNCGNGWKQYQCCPETGPCIEEEFACCSAVSGACANPELPASQRCPNEQCGPIPEGGPC